MSHRTGACPSAPPTLLTHCPWAEELGQTCCRYLCSVWGLHHQLGDAGLCLNIHQAVFCSGITPQLSHTEQASLLHPACPFLRLWCHLLLGMGCPVDDECGCCRTESLPGTELEKHLPVVSPRNPALVPPVPHSWRFPLRPYVTVSEQERSLQVAVWIL